MRDGSDADAAVVVAVDVVAVVVVAVDVVAVVVVYCALKTSARWFRC